MWPSLTKPSQPLGFGSGFSPMPTYDALNSLGSMGNVADGATDLVTGRSAAGGMSYGALGSPAPAPDVGPGGVVAPAGAGGFLKGIGGMEGLASIAEGLGSLGSIVAAFKGLGLAKDQFEFQKGAYTTNLANQTKSYNTELEDRAVARYQGAGMPAADAQAYFAKNKL